MVKMLMGIGNPLRGDDGAGTFVADILQAPGWVAVNCGTVPENCTPVVRRLHPEVLLLVDAAEMGVPPGEFRRIGMDRVERVAFSTHHMPLSLLMEFLADAAGEIVFVGIQPAAIGCAGGLSPEVRAGVRRLVDVISSGDLDAIPALETA
ncbi:MAG: hydrogenase maturation peptidase HycI [Methanomicrobiales archaeon]|nr:hydrogenase maturation peptidase HycI [Methanomicrobiales archaeon]MDI6877176.1 hydrogenase maturation peptidase HycI [Methanomicrobiales archaeon]